MTPLRKTVKQCRSCPWRVDCDPLRDIPNGYSVDLHEGLRGTIATPCLASLSEPCSLGMACHYSEVGKEIPCAGWLAHQLGAGNNLSLRIQVMRGIMPLPKVVGEQHPDFEATLPR